MRRPSASSLPRPRSNILPATMVQPRLRVAPPLQVRLLPPSSRLAPPPHLPRPRSSPPPSIVDYQSPQKGSASPSRQSPSLLTRGKAVLSLLRSKVRFQRRQTSPPPTRTLFLPLSSLPAPAPPTTSFPTRATGPPVNPSSHTPLHLEQHPCPPANRRRR